MVVSELRGEKIDIIPFNDEPARFVAKALSPARVREVLVDDDAKQATVIVPDDQLSLAIGREGQNARLAARLTGWRVDIRSETEFAAEEAEHGYEEEEVHGRCAAILSNGRRCPNAALPGSRYCGIETHQALAAIDSDKIVDLQAKQAPAEAPPEPAAAGAATAEETAPAEVAQPEAEATQDSAPGAEDGDAPAAQALAVQASDGEQPATAEQPAAADEGSLEPAAPVPGQQAGAQGSPAAGEERAQ